MGKFLSGILLTFFFLGLAPSAMAEPSNVSFATESGAQLEVKRTEKGDLYVEVPSTGSGLFIGSWQKATGTWDSPKAAMQDVTNLYECLNKDSNGGASLNSLAAEANELLAGVATNAGSPKSVESAIRYAGIVSCVKASDYATYLLRAFKNPSELALQKIPFEAVGSGKHTLFIQNFDLLVSVDGGECSSEPVDGEQGTMCGLRVGSVKTVEVQVPELTAEEAALLQKSLTKNGKAYFVKSSYSKLKTIDFSVFQNLGKLVAPVSTAVAVTGVFTVLIALPTTLLEASLEKNHTRVENFLKRMIPAQVRRRFEITDLEKKAEDGK